MCLQVRTALGDKVPVLMVSAAAQMGAVHTCLQRGADLCAAPVPPQVSGPARPPPPPPPPPPPSPRGPLYRWRQHGREGERGPNPGPALTPVLHASRLYPGRSQAVPRPYPGRTQAAALCSPACRLQPYVSRFMAKPLHVNIVENLWQHVLKKDPQWFEKQAGAPRSTPTPTTPPPTPRSPAYPAHPRFTRRQRGDSTALGSRVSDTAAAQTHVDWNAVIRSETENPMGSGIPMGEDPGACKQQ